MCRMEPAKCNNTHSSDVNSCTNCAHETTRFGVEQTLDEIQFENSIFDACVRGDLATVRRFVAKKGSQVATERDKSGYSPLHYAARNNHVAICELLIAHGADVNAKTASSLATPLHRAAFVGARGVVELLLASKANASERDCDGKCALHKCVENYVKVEGVSNTTTEARSLKETIKCLVAADRDLAYAKDNRGLSPIEMYPGLFNL